MKENINDFEMSFYVNIIDELLFNNKNEYLLDIYYNETGHPKYVHDYYGAKEIENFRLTLINKICELNNTNSIWRISANGFAILSKESNCDSFILEYPKELPKGFTCVHKIIEHKILKKTIWIKINK